MNVFQIKVDSKNKYHRGMSNSELYQGDLKKIDGASDIYYTYLIGNYEGSGNALIIKDGLFYIADLGHCSCYSPLDNYSFTTGYKSIEELKEKCSKEYLGDIEHLINAYITQTQSLNQEKQNP